MGDYSLFRAVQASEMISGRLDFSGRQPSSDRMRVLSASRVAGSCAATVCRRGTGRPVTVSVVVMTSCTVLGWPLPTL